MDNDLRPFPTLAQGRRLDYKELVGDKGFPFKGTRYNPKTVAGITSEGLLKGAVSKNGLIFGGIVSLAQNTLNFGKGKEFGSEEYWDATVKNREFWVSTGVDLAVSFVVGLAAAAIVAGAIAVLAGTTLGAVIALPAVAIIATAGVGMAIGWGIDATGLPIWAKTQVSGLLSK